MLFSCVMVLDHDQTSFPRSFWPSAKDIALIYIHISDIFWIRSAHKKLWPTEWIHDFGRNKGGSRVAVCIVRADVLFPSKYNDMNWREGEGLISFWKRSLGNLTEIHHTNNNFIHQHNM